MDGEGGAGKEETERRRGEAKETCFKPTTSHKQGFECQVLPGSSIWKWGNLLVRVEQAPECAGWSSGTRRCSDSFSQNRYRSEGLLGLRWASPGNPSHLG